MGKGNKTRKKSNLQKQDSATPIEEDRLKSSIAGLSVDLECRGLGFRVDYCEGKGRVCLSVKEFQPGNTILEEEAFVYGTDNPGTCLQCNGSDHTVGNCPEASAAGIEYPKELGATQEAILSALAELEGFQSVDKSKAWLKCLWRWAHDRESLSPLFSLTAPPTNLSRCLASVKLVRRQMPYLLPDGLSTNKAAEVLAILNTNGHALEELEGVGVFLTACLLEHSCTPNVNFTTHNTTLRLTALEHISIGQRLSIDYGNNYYRPTQERRSDLFKTYGFICDCALCVGELPDRCRCFKCPACSVSPKMDDSGLSLGSICWDGWGMVCPFGTGEENGSRWECLKCGQQLNSEQTQACLHSEATMKNTEASTLEELEELVSASLLHPAHHQVFWCLEEASEGVVLNTKSSPEDKVLSQQLWEKIMLCIEAVLPSCHHEKIVFFDRIAQTKVAVGDIKSSCEWYQKALYVSKVCCGDDHPSTIQLQNLVLDPPQSIEDLLRKYSLIL